MKKLFCLLLALLMLLPVVIACKKDEQPTGDGNPSGTVSTQGSDNKETAAEDKYDFNILDKLPAGNYSGKKFTAYLQNAMTYREDLLVEELNGETANDTIYEWITKIEERYNTDVVFSIAEGTSWTNALMADANAGEATYNIYGVMSFNIYQPIVNGYFADWNALNKEYIDMSASRWDSFTNGGVTFNGKLYGATGMIGPSKLKNTGALYFNVELMEQYADKTPEDLYKMVDDDQWTLETFETLVKDIYENLDTDPDPSGLDMYGHTVLTGNAYDAWMYGCGVRMFSVNNATGEVQVNVTNEWSKQVLADLKHFFTKNAGVANFTNQAYGDNQAGVIVNEMEAFADGLAVTVSARFGDAYTTFREMGTDAYGILPMPKYNTDQETYISFINDQNTVWGVNISLTESDRNFTAHIADALCAEGANTVIYKFYDVLLKGKYSRDYNTARMVDLIMETTYCDSGRQFGNYLQGTVGGKTTTYLDLIRQHFAVDDMEIADDMASLNGAVVVKLDEMLNRAYR